MRLVIVSSFGTSQSQQVKEVSVVESASDSSKIVISYDMETRYIRKSDVKQIIIEP